MVEDGVLKIYFYFLIESSKIITEVIIFFGVENIIFRLEIIIILEGDYIILVNDYM